MKIALLSGKGGTGKTFLAVNLAYCARRHEQSAAYIDCDVEEPNGHLFFPFPVKEKETVFTLIPSFNKEKCTSCRACADFCKFNALVFIKKTPMLLAEMCHACGGCSLVCPEKAITEAKRPIGMIETRQYENLSCYSGILNIGEANGIKIIQSLLQKDGGDFSVIDCPPGCACSVMESIEDADLCILIAEPTAFGLHNLNMVYELTAIMKKKTAVIINKEQSTPYEPLTNFCRQHNLPILAKIPFDRELGQTLSEGTAAYGTNKKFSSLTDNIYAQIKAMS